MMLAPGLAGVVLGTVGTVNTFLEGSSDRVAVVTASLLGIVLLLLPQLSLRMSRLESADPLLSPGPESQGKTRSIDAEYVKRNYLHGRRAMFSVRCGAGFALAVLTPSTVATGKWGVVVLGGILVILTLGSRAHYAHMDVVSEYVIAVLIFALACLAVMVTQPSWWLGLVIVLALLAGALIARHRQKAALAEAMRLVGEANKYIADTEPFKLKAPEQQERLATVLHTLAQAVADLNLMLSPFLPHAANDVDRVLGGNGRIAPMPRIEEVDELDPERLPEAFDGRTGYPIITGDYQDAPTWERHPVTVGTPVAKPTPVFTKLDESIIEAELARYAGSVPDDVTGA